MQYYTVYCDVFVRAVASSRVGAFALCAFTQTNKSLKPDTPLRPLQYESKNPPPYGFLNFFPNGWEFLINFLLTYYTIISTVEYKFLFKYLQL